MSYPLGIIVDDSGQIHIADNENHRMMCWCEGDDEGRIIISENDGDEETNQLSSPIGLSFDVEGNLYVADFENNRISKFEDDIN